MAIPRYDPPRGVSARVADLVDDPKVRREVLRIIDQGDAMGGRNWYNTEPLRRPFIDELGPEEGGRRFAQYVDLIAATSPRNPIGSNVRTASYYYYDVLSRGEPLPDRPAAPYGELVEDQHLSNIRGLLERGGWDVLRNPKPASYAANIQGNQLPGTNDTHSARLPAMISRDPRFL